MFKVSIIVNLYPINAIIPCVGYGFMVRNKHRPVGGTKSTLHRPARLPESWWPECPPSRICARLPAAASTGEAASDQVRHRLVKLSLCRGPLRPDGLQPYL